MIASVEREPWKTFTQSLRELWVPESKFSRNISCRPVDSVQLLAKHTSFAWQSYCMAVVRVTTRRQRFWSSDVLSHLMMTCISVTKRLLSPYGFQEITLWTSGNRIYFHRGFFGGGLHSKLAQGLSLFRLEHFSGVPCFLQTNIYML